MSLPEKSAETMVENYVSRHLDKCFLKKRFQRKKIFTNVKES